MFSTFISKRYFLGRKKMFSSFLSVLAVFGVTLGVFALVVVMSVMLGFAHDLESRLIGFNAHVIVEPTQEQSINFDEVLKIAGDNVESSAEIIDGEGIAQVKDAEGDVAQGVKIRGMDEADLKKLKGIEIYSRTETTPSNSPLKGGEPIILGSELAMQMGLDSDNNEKLTLVSPIGRVGPTGDIIPEKMNFIVTGLFKSGYFEHDSKTVIISKKAAEKLLGKRAYLHIWLKNYRDSKKVAAKIKAAFPESDVRTWTESNKKLFAALHLERIAMSLLLTLIVIIACISIASVIFMYVYLRRKDIAIISSLGAANKEIRAIFLKIGSFIGMIGTFIGLCLGLAVCVMLKHQTIALPSSYYLDHLPVVIYWPFIISVAILGIVLAVIAAYFPANQAVKLKPQELLRYE